MRRPSRSGYDADRGPAELRSEDETPTIVRASLLAKQKALFCQDQCPVAAVPRPVISTSWSSGANAKAATQRRAQGGERSGPLARCDKSLAHGNKTSARVSLKAASSDQRGWCRPIAFELPLRVCELACAAPRPFEARSHLGRGAVEARGAVQWVFPRPKILGAPAIESVILIERRLLVRECFAACLERASGYNVISFGSPQTYLERADRTKVDLIVLCTSGGLNDAETSRQISLLSAEALPVVLIDDREDADQIVKAPEAGARGFIPSTLFACRG